MIVRTRECEEELNALDAELGDGDLGSTLVSVAGAVEQSLDSLVDDLGASLRQLSKVIGGVSGSSFSSLLMVGLSSAGTVLHGKTTVSTDDCLQVWRTALTAMLAASGARLGDKTLLDGMDSIAQAPPRVSWVDEVNRTIELFRPKACRAGRARVAAERSIGRDDPGMVAMLRLIEGATGQRAAR